MKRKVILIVAFVLIFCSCANSVSNQSTAPEPTQTTTSPPATIPPTLKNSEIMFLDIPWGTPEDIALQVVKNRFPEINKEETVTYPLKDYSLNRTEPSHNFADPQGRIITPLSSTGVKTKTISLKSVADARDFEYYCSFGPIGGYMVDTINLTFIEIESQFVLLSASFSFKEDKDISPILQFSDLERKMTSLYGDPASYDYEEEIVTPLSTRCSVWSADDGSAAYLTYKLYKSGYLAGAESVLLYYGTTQFNGVFTTAKETEDEANREKMNEVFQDSSGL